MQFDVVSYDWNWIEIQVKLMVPASKFIDCEYFACYLNVAVFYLDGMSTFD